MTMRGETVERRAVQTRLPLELWAWLQARADKAHTSLGGELCRVVEDTKVREDGIARMKLNGTLGSVMSTEMTAEGRKL